ncbi:MAG TPA: MFS transporter [Actinomycetales bacterium]|nr:MFS transporter [Actinomycetales bacterium]
MPPPERSAHASGPSTSPNAPGEPTPPTSPNTPVPPRGTHEPTADIADPQISLEPSQTEQMTRAERVFFAAGDMFGGGGSTLIAVLYLFYLTDVIGIPPGWAATAVLLPKIWDAINDPLMGIITDNARTRWGRRRPFITVGSVLLLVALAAIWAPIGGWDSLAAKVTFVIIANLFYTTVATMIAVPYASLSTEATSNYQERNRINVMRLAFSTVSSAACTLLGTMLMQAYTSGQLSGMELYLTVVFGFGLLFALPLIIAMWLTRERTPIPAERTRFSLVVALEPLRLDSFRKLLWMYLAQALTMDVISALVIYYALYVVQLSPTVFLGIFIVVNLIGFAVVNQLVKHVSKSVIYRFLLPLAMLGAIGIGLYPATWPGWGIYVVALVVAVGLCGSVLMSWVMFPDVIDDAELTTGARNAGTYSGLMTLIRGIATAVAVWLIGLMLQFTGYQAPEDYADPTQPAATLIGIRITMAGSIVLFMAFGWWAAKKYPLTIDVCRRMQERLGQARSEQATYLPE